MQLVMICTGSNNMFIIFMQLVLILHLSDEQNINQFLVTEMLHIVSTSGRNGGGPSRKPKPTDNLLPYGKE